MRNADYWRGRFSILEDSAHREAQKTIQDMEELYLDAQRSVQKEIESWYARFAVNNQISLTDARKWLTAGQLEEFHWSVEQYIKIGEQAGLDAAWLKKLENASARFHISRLEAVQTGIQQQLELLYGNQVDSLDALLKKVVGNGYTHTAFEVQKGVGLGWDITGLDQKNLKPCFQSLGQQTGELLVIVFGSRSKNWSIAFKKNWFRAFFVVTAPKKSRMPFRRSSKFPGIRPQGL